MYATQGSSKNENGNEQPKTSSLKTSQTLIRCGIVDIFASLLLLCWSIWTITVDPVVVVSSFGIISAVFHTTFAILVIKGGHDMLKKKGLITAALVLGIIGGCAVSVATLIADAFSWSRHTDWCRVNCQFKDNVFYQCPNHCAVEFFPALIHVPIMVFAIIEGGIACFVTSIIGLNLRHCCDLQTMSSDEGMGFYPISAVSTEKIPSTDEIEDEEINTPQMYPKISQL